MTDRQNHHQESDSGLPVTLSAHKTSKLSRADDAECVSSSTHSYVAL